VLNTLAACAVTGAAGVPVEAMRAAVESFAGVEHRLETVAMIEGVTWVNDSIATAPERVIAALRSYAEPLVLLAGGRDKKLPWDEMTALAAIRCRAVIAFGEYGPHVVEHLNRAKARNPGARLERVIRVDDLAQAVSEAQRVARPGDVVLLSRAARRLIVPDFAARGSISAISCVRYNRSRKRWAVTAIQSSWNPVGSSWCPYQKLKTNH
jgi:UDP-N-acetylmuramoylalanine--D-glutamate ligase